MATARAATGGITAGVPVALVALCLSGCAGLQMPPEQPPFAGKGPEKSVRAAVGAGSCSSMSGVRMPEPGTSGRCCR